MSTTGFKRSGLMLLLAFIMLVPTACGRQNQWERIYSAELSSDESALTVELTISPPNADGTFCQQVVDKKVIESASQVMIAIQTRDNCAPTFPWQHQDVLMIGHPFNVDLRLQKPLGKRTVLDKETQQEIRVDRPSAG
ncbi:hypothetical protein [Microtetraspora malaysiensis]|uniref:hypothetical protein n=1 Tax=Microtetraspora malaysiensis TaxID=161358 RepID=UPI003D8E1739